jgi:hypothetical protein
MLSFLMLSSRSASRPGATPTASQNKIQRPIISPASPVESTLPILPGSVHSKSLVVTRFPLESTLTRKPRGEGSIIVNQTRDEACLSRTTIGSEGPLRSPYEAILSRAANGTGEILWGRFCQQSDSRSGPGLSGNDHRQPARISPELLVNRDFLTLAWFISFQQK